SRKLSQSSPRLGMVRQQAATKRRYFRSPTGKPGLFGRSRRRSSIAPTTSLVSHSASSIAAPPLPRIPRPLHPTQRLRIHPRNHPAELPVPEVVEDEQFDRPVMECVHVAASSSTAFTCSPSNFARNVIVSASSRKSFAEVVATSLLLSCLSFA